MTEASKSSDVDLLRALHAGDGEAFTILYRRWQGPLYRFALRMRGSATVAEEVTQEPFVALTGDSQGFDASRGTVPSYLYGIARNRGRRVLARERNFVPLEEDAFSPTAEAGGPNDLSAD